MTSKNRPVPQDIAHVAIPEALLDIVDDFFDAFGHEVMKEAVTLAFARRSGTSPGRVTADDLRRALKTRMQSMAEEFDRELKSCETPHAARKAS
jgi:predicted Ser/Thr protein kinase